MYQRPEEYPVLPKIVSATAGLKGVVVRKIALRSLEVRYLNYYFCIYCQCTVAGAHYHFFKTKSMKDTPIGIFEGFDND